MADLTHGACYAAFYGSGPPLELPFLARLVRSFDLAGELRVLDIGCGTARLRPGGVVVLEGANFEWILDHYREPQTSEADVDGIRVCRVPRHDVDRSYGTWAHTDRFSTPGTGEELIMVHRLAIIPIDEVRSALHDAGLDHVESYTSWASTAPSEPDGSRIIAVGRRPG